MGELYRRLLAGVFARAKDARAVNNVVISGHGVITENDVDLEMPDGSVKTGKILGIVAVEDGQIAGERAYFDPVFLELYESALAAEFYALPGVTWFD